MLARTPTASDLKRRSYQFLIERLLPLAKLSADRSTQLLWALAHGNHTHLYEQSAAAFRELVAQGLFEELQSSTPGRLVFRSTRSSDCVALVVPNERLQSSRPTTSTRGTVSITGTVSAKGTGSTTGTGSTKGTVPDVSQVPQARPAEGSAEPPDFQSESLLRSSQTNEKLDIPLDSDGLHISWAKLQGLLKMTELSAELQSLSHRLPSALEVVQKSIPAARLRLWCIDSAGNAVRGGESVRFLSPEELKTHPDLVAAIQGVGVYYSKAAEGVATQSAWAPIRQGAHVWGVLQAELPNGTLVDSWKNPGNCELLVGAARLLEIAVHNQTTLERLVFLDPLTGVYNRGFYDRQLALEIERACRTNRTFALLVMDVDDFKRINDEFGHLAGDHVLTSLAQTVRSHMRKIDLMFRYGGEEFTFLLPGAEEEEAHRTAERLRLVVEKHPFQVDGVPIHVTVSVGLAIYPDQGRTPSGLFKTADTALYGAKKQGKNQVMGSQQSAKKP